MKSKIESLLLCVCVVLCGGNCTRTGNSNATINIVISPRSGNAGAIGDWKWETYIPWENPNRHSYLQVHIQDERGQNSYSSGFAGQELEWISDSSDKAEESDAPVHFALIRPSGRWDFQGRRSAWGLSGRFRFKPDPRFVAEVERACGSRPELDDLIKLNFANATVEGLWRYRDAGLSLDVDGWLRLLNYGISPDYASDMKWALGKVDAEALVELHNYGMTPEFASGYTDAGYAFNHKELIQLRNYGVQPEFAAELRRGGMMLNVDQLTRLHNYGVQPSYALRMRELGVGNNIEAIIQVRNYGVPEDFVAGLRKSGYNLSMEEIVKLRNSGVPASYMSTVKKCGYSFTVDEVIKLRNSGVPESYLAEIVQSGHKPLSADTIVDLYTHGVSAETVRAVRVE